MKQTLEQWLAERKKGIGGSDAAAVLSEGFGCPRALFLDKSGVEPDYKHGDETMGLFERGHALEPLIARKFTQETGLNVRTMPTRVSAERPWMRVNVDRMIVAQDDGLGSGYLECKTANEHVFANMRAEGMPPHYIIQVQHGLAVTGWQWGFFAVLEPYTFRFLYFRFERDQKLIEVLLQIEDTFWRDVQAGNIPGRLADFNDQRCEKCVYRRSCRNAEALPAKKRTKVFYVPDSSPELFQIVGQIKRVDAQMEQLQSIRSEAYAELKGLLGTREKVLVPGQGKKISLTMQSGALRWDTKALDAEHPELAGKYKRRGEAFQSLRMYEASELPEAVLEALREVA